MTGDPVVIDTDVASGLMRDSLPPEVRFKLVGVVLCVTFVTVGELFRGAAHAGWGARRLAGLVDWLSRLTVIPAEHAVARRWGEITGQALAAGRPLPANDAWIAACCLTHGVELATLNLRDFRRIEGLRLITDDADA